MSSIETTELKLRTTPTGGVSGEHSPYYRRLLSAGYKGYLQGTLGGAGYYGLLGLAVGALVGVPAMIFTGPIALMLIPAVAGLGVLKGADTFGNIGTVAAINAESADLAEQRRYLLDRYYDLPEGPEGDKQAEIIKQELATQVHTREPHQLFHWKTVAICAAIGGVLALTFLSPMGFGLLAEGPIAHALAAAFGHAALEGGVTVGLTATMTAVGTAIGALAGATIGVDRHYVRAWFDGTERILHDESHAQQAIEARVQQIERIKAAAMTDEQTRRIVERGGQLHLNEQNLKTPAITDTVALDAASQTPALKRNPAANIAETAAATTTETPIAKLNPDAVLRNPSENLDAPVTKIMSAKLEGRMRDIQQAMQIPAV